MELEIGGKKFRAEVRWAYDLKPVLAYPSELKENFPAYYMFRDVYYDERDHEIVMQHGLRYDVTVIPPGKIGSEFIKTFGHYHPIAEQNLSYTEIYEVLKGEALFLLQRAEGARVYDVFAVEAGKGDKVIVPPNYGHVTINPSKNELRIANWVYRNFRSIYEPYERFRGACYYYTDEGWIVNPNYKEVPKMRLIEPKIPKELGLGKDDEIYELVRDIKKLEFLYRPSKYLEMFEIKG